MNDQDSLAVVKSGYDAFLKADIDGLLLLVAEEVAWETPSIPGVAWGGIRRGKAGVAEFFRQLNDTEEVLQFEPREFIVDGERVGVLGRFHIRVKSTNRIHDTPWIHFFTVQNGKITRFFELLDSAVVQRSFQT